MSGTLCKGCHGTGHALGCPPGGARQMPVPRQPWTCDSLSCMNVREGAASAAPPRANKDAALATEAFGILRNDRRGPKPNASSSTRILKKHTMKKGDVFKRTVTAYLVHTGQKCRGADEVEDRGEEYGQEEADNETPSPPKALPSGLRKKQGVWVFSTGQPTTAAHLERLRQSIYRERENRFLACETKAQAESKNKPTCVD